MEENSETAVSPVTAEEMLLKAQQELNEVPAERSDRIQAFREAVCGVPGLKSRTDDSFLLRFLRVCKFDQAKALELVKIYYKQRTKYPELYRDFLASSVPNVLAKSIYGCLPYKDAQGRSIIIKNCKNWDLSTVSTDDLLRYETLTMECIAEQEEAQLFGVIILVDAKGFGFRHFLTYSPGMMTKISSVSLNSFPLSIKEIHIINAPVYARWLFNIFQPFLSKEIKVDFFFHGLNLDALHERFPKKIIPEEFGGFTGAFSNAEWNIKLLENDVNMKRDNVYGFQSDPV